MSEVTESKWFQEQKAKSLNAVQSSAAPWRLPPKSMMQAADAMKRVRQDLEEGILTKLRLERQQELMTSLADKCYKNNDYTYQQAATCQEFYEQNDFKLNLLNSFVRDHMSKHIQAYEKCYSGASFESLGTNDAKDREFLSCHKSWMNNLKSDVTYELELKARGMFQAQ